MIDRGWRRSGTYCYKPDLKRSCCPQYTIKLDALQFKPSRSQRKLLHRWNRFVLYDEHGGVDHDSSANKTDLRKRKPTKSKGKEQAFSLTSEIHASERRTTTDEKPAHSFEVTLELSSYTDEKFKLYQSYQKEIHHETEEKPSGFKGFLVESPLHSETIPYSAPCPEHLPRAYGSYHQLYRLDGELIAMGVIDIVPSCVSSVYFMYEKKWERFSLGKLSALREASLAKEIHGAGAPEMNSLYMGFYIHSCPKMRYKGDYSPSYLADPEDYTWFPLEQTRVLLDKYRYASFAHPEHCLEGPPNPQIQPSVPELPRRDLRHIQLMDRVDDGAAVTIPIMASPEWRRPAARQTILSLVYGLGLELAKEILLYLAYEI
ncbi:Arginyl-tRNA--protein transferase 1 [Sparassis crispa]|uniref:arginyltransferase n=1 Tax=Sparassis crispa TaxID=139825 RepID=A0A401GC45_9APHY|nr:Arginyl-tRNA--protein transferase 1 [Sparassis crispa]GBE79744.1 Arginyl-tRNA--protein transferase 1 [Sparassis crispa]